MAQKGRAVAKISYVTMCVDGHTWVHFMRAGRLRIFRDPTLSSYARLVRTISSCVSDGHGIFYPYNEGWRYVVDRTDAS